MDGEVEPPEPTEQTTFGGYLDNWLTGGKLPDPLEGKVLIDFKDFRTDSAKAKRDELVASGVPLKKITTHTIARNLQHASGSKQKELKDCGRAVRECEVANKLLLGGKGLQQEALFADYHGTLIKSLPDRVIPGVAIVDLKTTADDGIGAFMNSSRRFWYSTQAFMGVHCWKENTGEELPFIFVVVSRGEFPKVDIIQASDGYLLHGEKRMQRAIEDFNRCTKSGVWSRRTDGKVQTTTVPDYWFKEFDNDE